MDERYTEMCNDNRFELIKKYKDKLIEATNIETNKAEMAVIDSVLFRFWQMGWLDRLEDDTVPKSEYEAIVNALDNSTKEFLKLHDNYQNLKKELESTDTKLDIVRCKDCTKRHTPECAMRYDCNNCGGQWSWENDDVFCSFAERKTEQST